MKYLNLAGYLGLQANDATEGFVEVDEELVEKIQLLKESGFAVTVDLEAVVMDDKIQTSMIDAFFKSAYHSMKLRAALTQQKQQDKVIDEIAKSMKRSKEK